MNDADWIALGAKHAEKLYGVDLDAQPELGAVRAYAVALKYFSVMTATQRERAAWFVQQGYAARWSELSRTRTVPL